MALRTSMIAQANHIHQLGGGFVNDFSIQFNPTGGSGQRLDSSLTDTDVWTSNPVGSFTAAFWYEVDATMAQFRGPVGSAPNSALGAGWGVYRNTTDNEGRFYVGAFNVSGFTFTHTGLWTVSGWHHLVLVFDEPNRQFTTYWDDTQSQSATDHASTTRNLGVDHAWGSSDSGGGTTGDFTGKLDTIAFWGDVIATSGEASSLYNGGVPIDPTSIIAGADYWLSCGDDPSDDITVSTGQVTDQTGNANHFTPNGQDNVPPMNFNADVP